MLNADNTATVVYSSANFKADRITWASAAASNQQQMNSQLVFKLSDCAAPAPSQDQGKPSQDQGKPSQDQGAKPKPVTLFGTEPSQDQGKTSPDQGKPSQDQSCESLRFVIDLTSIVQSKPSQDQGKPSQDQGKPQAPAAPDQGKPSQDQGKPAPVVPPQP